MASKKTAEPTEPQTFDEPPRRLEDVVVEKRILTENSFAVEWSNGWTNLIPERSLEKHFPVGAHVTVEMVRFSHLVGLKVAGVWVWRKSDADLREEMTEAEAVVAKVEAARASREEAAAAENAAVEASVAEATTENAAAEATVTKKR